MVDFKKQSKEFTELRRDAARLRRQATGTLSPSQIRSAVKSGEVPASWIALSISRPDGTPFNIDDLISMRSAQNRASKSYNRYTKSGVPIPQLIASSLQIDIDRANGVATRGSLPTTPPSLYKVYGDTVFFSVRASGENGATKHQVRIRLHEWNNQLRNINANKNTAVMNSVKGGVSIDCGCGRHQFWYRYLAGVGNYAIQPPTEKDFPKERNPSLKGCCCKHVIKALGSIKTPTVRAVLANQMEKQRKRSGFGEGKPSQRFIGKRELEKISRGKPQKASIEKAKKQLRKINNAKKVFEGALKKRALSKKVKNELETLTPRGVPKKLIEAAAKALADPRSSQIAKMRVDIDNYKKLGIPISKNSKLISEGFAKREGISVSEANLILSEIESGD